MFKHKMSPSKKFCGPFLEVFLGLLISFFLGLLRSFVGAFSEVVWGPSQEFGGADVHASVGG